MFAKNRARLTGCLPLLAAIIGTSACQKWVPLQPLNLGLEAQACRPLPDRDELRLDLSDGTVMEGKLVALSADSVTVGSDPVYSVTVSIEQIRNAEARQPDGKGTALTGIGITLGAVAVAATVSAMGEPTGESVSELSGAVRQ
jgi:hypothetical protein